MIVMFKIEEADKPYRVTEETLLQRKDNCMNIHIEKVQEYIDFCEREERFPNIFGLADYLGISVNLAKQMMENNPEFDEMVSRANTKGVDKLIQKSLRKEWDSKTSGLILSQYGISDQSKSYNLQAHNSPFVSKQDIKRIDRMHGETSEDYKYGTYYYPEKKPQVKEEDYIVVDDEDKKK